MMAHSSCIGTYIGITGTNGKTTCAWWSTQLLRDLGQKPGLIGTLGCGVWKKNTVTDMQETGYTTPDATLLQKILADFEQQGATHVVMEVSSHGLQQGRVKGVTFSTALFTNLSRDHLDYHGNMEDYGAAKLRLFQFAGLQHAVVNVDDAFGKSIIENCEAPLIITYSLAKANADVFIENIKMSAEGVRGNLVTPWGNATLFAPVVGEFNVSNLLGVISVLCAEGFDLAAVVAAVKILQAPPGRLQRVVLTDSAENNLGLAVFVDFAHTPDALEKVLSALRTSLLKQKLHGKLWCVFGCGGDRDSGKRAEMGEVVSRLADHCVVTSDNPRSENPQDILKQILMQMDQKKTITLEDRRSAIQHAIASASNDDVVLIAGKGHEKYQEAQGIKLPFSDVDEAALALRMRGRS